MTVQLKTDKAGKTRDRAAGRRAGMLTASIAIGIALGVVALIGPTPLSSTADETEFSAERAAEHIAQLSVSPRPTGWPANVEARNSIAAELKSLGLAVKLHAARSVEGQHEIGMPVQMADVVNVVAQLEGLDASLSPVVFVAHFDSTPSTTGASDNGYGVGALLETARALSASDPLQRGITFVFSDGEEAGLLGARAYFSSLASSGEIRAETRASQPFAVINFDARGNAGPAILYQLGPDSGGLVSAFASAASHPVANSLGASVASILPNSTDFEEARAVGHRGLAFANVSGAAHYHASTDKSGAISRRTLQHHGDNALAMARALGGQTSTDPRSWRCCFL